MATYKDWIKEIEVDVDCFSAFIKTWIAFNSWQRTFFDEVVQKVEIYYKMIGYVELPEMSKSQKDSFLKTFGRKKTDQSA